MQIENNLVKRILVDNGSSVDELYYNAFQDHQLTPSPNSLYDFYGTKTTIEGVIQLSVTIRDGELKSTQMVIFVVVKYPSSYTVIFGMKG